MTGREIEERLAALETKMSLIVYIGGLACTVIAGVLILVIVGVIRA